MFDPETLSVLKNLAICVVVVSAIIGVFLWSLIFRQVFVVLPRRNKKEKEEKENRRRREEEAEKEEPLNNLRENVLFYFHFPLSEVKEKANQDEIVRIVNLRAYQAAQACVNQEYKIRNGNDSPQAAIDVVYAKGGWASIRNLALEIAPELEDQMPHFSEFEPLKSYREEHLVQKQAKKSAAGD